MEICVTVNYRAGHSIGSTYSKEDIYCPNCGTQNVWSEMGGGDVYVGSKHVCTGCDHSFYLPSLSVTDEYEEQVIEQIKLNGGTKPLTGTEILLKNKALDMAAINRYNAEFVRISEREFSEEEIERVVSMLVFEI